jgi:hypothetical protein
MNKKVSFLVMIFVLFFLMFFTFGCDSTPRAPTFKQMGSFEYRFSECREVVIKYQGQLYTVRQNDGYDGDRFNQTLPFVYEFEDDGDLDIRINGRDYDLDSPCDIGFDPWKKSRRRGYRGYNDPVIIIPGTVVHKTIIVKEKPTGTTITSVKKTLTPAEKKAADAKKAAELKKKKDAEAKKKKAAALKKKKKKSSTTTKKTTTKRY